MKHLDIAMYLNKSDVDIYDIMIHTKLQKPPQELPSRRMREGEALLGWFTYEHKHYDPGHYP